MIFDIFCRFLGQKNDFLSDSQKGPKSIPTTILPLHLNSPNPTWYSMVWNEFWELPRESQKAWAIATVENEKPKRPRKHTREKRARNSARKYYLKDDKYERRKVDVSTYARV